MKPYRVFFSLILIITFVSFPVGADQLSPPDKGWDEVQHGKNFAVYAKDVKGSDVQAVLLIGILNFPPEKVFNVCTDYAHFQDFMPYVQLSHVVKVEEPHKNERISYVFYYLSPPLISARYYTLKYTDQMNITYKGTTGSYMNKWCLITDGIYHESPETPGIKKLLHNKHGIELKADQGYWVFVPLKGGKQTKMSYYVVTNPGGSIPHWIQNKAEKVSVGKLYDTVKRRLENPKYAK